MALQLSAWRVHRKNKKYQADRGDLHQVLGYFIPWNQNRFAAAFEHWMPSEHLLFSVFQAHQTGRKSQPRIWWGGRHWLLVMWPDEFLWNCQQLHQKLFLNILEKCLSLLKNCSPYLALQTVVIVAYIAKMTSSRVQMCWTDGANYKIMAQVIKF